jgi:hypothetical protein
VTAVLARLLILGLMLEGLIVAPAMRDSQLHSAVSQVTISQPAAAADPTPEPSYPIVLPSDDPRAIEALSYCPAEATCGPAIDYGPIDPLWTPEPTFNYPADCAALYAEGGASLQCPSDPTP